MSPDPDETVDKATSAAETSAEPSGNGEDAEVTPRAGSSGADGDDDEDDEDDEEESIEERVGVSDAEHLAAIEQLRVEMEQERARAAELREQLLRTAADFDNYRKRTERDRVEERKQAAAGIVRGVLPVVDGLNRALAVASGIKGNPELATFVEGVRLIESQLMETLGQAGLERVATDGVFDPVYHEALMQEPSTDAPHLSVLEVYEPGFRFGGRLLRPARVKVAFNPGGDAEHDAAEAGSADGAERGTGRNA